MKKSKAVVCLSGGIDSCVVAALQVAIRRQVVAVSFDYGQRHAREIAAARRIASRLGVEHRILSVNLQPSGALLGVGDVPSGHYASAAMRSTVVKGRNLVLAALALQLALSIDADVVALGVHASDHAIYPDCRPAFVRALANLALVADERPVAIETPLLHLNKPAVVSLGLALQAPLDLTWSCYSGGAAPCANCGACNERAEAFSLNQTPDPWQPN